MLYRLPGQQDAEEAGLLAKYVAIAVDLKKLGTEPSSEELDAVIQSNLE